MEELHNQTRSYRNPCKTTSCCVRSLPQRKAGQTAGLYKRQPYRGGGRLLQRVQMPPECQGAQHRCLPTGQMVAFMEWV